MLSGWKLQTRSILLISEMPMVPLLIRLFQSSTVLSESEEHGLIISSSKNKSCPLDPIPTKLVIECLDVLLPPITRT